MSAALRHPPAFQIDTGPQPLLQGLIAGVAVLSAASLVAALSLHWPMFAWLLLAVPAIGVVAWRLARVEPRHLQWDGQLWRLAPASQLDPGAPVEVAVLFDFGDWLLLRAQEGGRSGWLWPLPRRSYLPLTRKAHGAQWAQLRATVYSARPVVPSTA